MFDITPDDIALLNDTDLRNLVGRLSEAELRSRGLSAACVTWGGDQNAADDGVDVHVDLPAGTQIDGFVPRAGTVFQAKKMDLEPADIKEEMRPKGVIRPVIQELANQGGAYIIATSSSVTYRKLKSRLAAMKDAVSDVANAGMLKLDYYDRTRIASWVRSHPGVILWVRSKIGKSVAGWRPYGAWATPTEGVDAEYLLDDHLRVETGRQENGTGLSAAAGIEHIRNILNSPGSVVRLVGLSGVGKTRFVQALFDSRVGQNNLNPDLAVYTNMSDSPDPQPHALATDLATMGHRAILVVDNCTPDLHRSLSSVCRTAGSKLSVVTVEYDIREDLPEGTDVFKLEPSSPELIKKLIKHRFPKMVQVSVDTIADNSDGNARVALALAATVGVNETISSLADEDLFRRLFQQGHGHDESLLIAAQALSLVYSFHGENVSDDLGAELVRIGRTIGKSAQEMYGHAATLRDRDLVQQRDVWRAVLPHAVANRLAKHALKRVPPETIQANLVSGASERLLRSFSRRLGYLSDSKEAAAISQSWLAPEGLLGNVANLNEFGKALLGNVAPVAPVETLAALERAYLASDSDEAIAHCREYVRLIRLLAYDAGMFTRCAALLCRFAGSEEVGSNSSDSARNVFVSLFSLYLSGTHATIEQRLDVLKPLLLSVDAKEQELGLKALGAMLEATHIGSAYSFEFGSRVRDYGYWPKTVAEVQEWFTKALQFATGIACSKAASAKAVQKVIADKFRGLWSVAAMEDELVKTCPAIASKGFWRDGWVAVRETQAYDGKGLPLDSAARLSSLEECLRPKDLVQSIRAIVLSDGKHYYELVEAETEDDSTEAMKKKGDATDKRVRELGQLAAQDRPSLDEVVHETLTSRGLLWMFGEGLAEGSADLRATWEYLKGHCASTPREKLNVQVLAGFISKARRIDIDLANTLLDEAVDDETLGYFFPHLGSTDKIDERGTSRLMRSLSLGKAPISMYESLRYGRVMDSIPPKALSELVLTVASKENGWDVAVELMNMRLHFEKPGSGGIAADLRETGWSVLQGISFTARNQQEDYRLAIVAKACLPGENCAERVSILCKRLKAAVASHKTSIIYYDDLLVTLLNIEPGAALQALCEGDASEAKRGLRIIEDAQRSKNGLFQGIPHDVLLDWCESDPSVRYPALAAGIPISTNEDKAGTRNWTPLALLLLDKAPDRVEILKMYMRQIRLSGGWGSPASIIEANASLLDKLPPTTDQAAKAFVAAEKQQLAKEIEELKREETARDRKRTERFE